MKELPIRKNIRLTDYDYSQNGAYFITICVKGGHEIFWKPQSNVGAIINRPQLSDAGKNVDVAIENISRIYEYVVVDKYIIMPNHIHMIIVIQNNDLGQDVEGYGRLLIAPTKSLSIIIKQLKSEVTKQVGYSIWQRSFYDHIIRNENEYLKIWQYIDENPMKWEEDDYYNKGGV
jgi:REP element-mobilizing transposase RayT